MARYKVQITVYKDPSGKTLKGPTALHFLGDLCSGFGLMGVLGTILAVMEKYGPMAVITGVVMAVVGFALAVVLHKRAKQDAQRAFAEALAGLETRQAD